MEVIKAAIDPVLGMLVACPEGCGEKSRMRVLEVDDETTAKCTRCGATEEFQRNMGMFVSFHIRR